MILSEMCKKSNSEIVLHKLITYYLEIAYKIGYRRPKSSELLQLFILHK